jgi:hypothetical protein
VEGTGAAARDGSGAVTGAAEADWAAWALGSGETGTAGLCLSFAGAESMAETAPPVSRAAVPADGSAGVRAGAWAAAGTEAGDASCVVAGLDEAAATEEAP